MTTLITAGASTVGAQVAQYLHNDGYKVIFGARSGKRIPNDFKWVHLDWDDPSTFSNPFSPNSTPSSSVSFNASYGENYGITAIYIVSPMTDLKSSGKIIPFIRIALGAGVTRFVYLSASIADSKHDSGGLGKIPKFFEDLVKEEPKYQDVDYVILRPTWFTDNLLTEFGDDIRKHNQVTTCVPTGKIPWVASSEIARVGYEGIVYGSEHFKRHDPLIIGPELLSYNDITNILTNVLGRKIKHNVVGEAEILEFYKKLYGDDGSTSGSAAFLEWSVELDRGQESHNQEGLDEVEGVVIGKIGVEDWVRERKAEFE